MRSSSSRLPNAYRFARSHAGSMRAARSSERLRWAVAGGFVAVGTGLLLRRVTREFDQDGVVARSSAAALWAAYAGYAGLLGAATRRRAIPLPLRHTIARPTSVLLIGAGAAMVVAGGSRFASPGQLTGTDAGPLVTRGIYRWSRNPQYVGCELVALGVAIAGRSGAALGLAFGAAGVFAYWVGVEGRTLERRFGDAYRTYGARTPRWIGVPAHQASR
jgi:protein-S-isoprenylcysteine O-methyltransferase Ste14